VALADQRAACGVGNCRVRRRRRRRQLAEQGRADPDRLAICWGNAGAREAALAAELGFYGELFGFEKRTVGGDGTDGSE